jgi:hypothetical protein
MKRYTGPPTTLGNAATAKVRLIVWCRDCQHRIESETEGVLTGGFTVNRASAAWRALVTRSRSSS